MKVRWVNWHEDHIAEAGTIYGDPGYTDAARIVGYKTCDRLDAGEPIADVWDDAVNNAVPALGYDGAVFAMTSAVSEMCSAYAEALHERISEGMGL